MPDETLAALSEEERAEKWREWLASRPDITVLVAESSGAIAGFASVGPSRDADGAPGAHEIYAIYVDPGHWRSGLGRELVLEASKDRPTVTLWVLEQNGPARKFYEAMGFVLDGGRKTERIGAAELVEVRYRR